MINDTAPKGKDAVGLPQFDVRYAKRSCKECHGRGKLLHLVGDGYHTVDGQRVPNPNKTLDMCICANRGYGKVRRALEKRVAAIMAPDQLSEDLCKAIGKEYVPPTQEEAQAQALKEMSYE